MTVISPEEEILRLKRHIAVDLIDRVISSDSNIVRSKENIWEIFDYFYKKLTEEE